MSGFSTVNVVHGGNRVQTQPGGPAAGDLTGSYEAGPIVDAIQTYPIDPRSPNNGDTLIFNGGEWIPTPSPTSVTYFQGSWDASVLPKGDPDITVHVGLKDGDLWIVSVAGNATVGGITGWLVGDYALYSDGDWYKLSNGSFGWLLTGNNGTNPTINFIGTADEEELSIRANSVEGLRILTNGSVTAAQDLTVTKNITGSNERLTGDLAVNGGNISTTSTTFNLVNNTATTVNLAGGATTFNAGNIGGTNTVLGQTKFSQGLSGSHTKLADGSSFLIAGTNMTVVTGANGAVTLTAIPSGSDTQIQFNDGGSIFGASAGLTFNKTNSSLTITGDVTASNARLSGDLAVNGGNITTTATTFNLLAGASTALNVGNSGATNTFSGTSKFPQGISGSLTRLTDGTSAFVEDSGIIIISASNGAVTFRVDETKFAALTGSTFLGPVIFSSGLSGSLTRLADGTPAFVTGAGITITSASNDPITVKMSNTGSAGSYGSTSQIPVFNTDAQGRVTSVTNASVQIAESQVTNLVTDLANVTGSISSLSSSLDSDKANKAVTLTAGNGLLGGGDLSANRSFSINNAVVATISGSTFTGAVNFNSGLSGSLTKLTDGSSYLVAGTNMTVVTNSNGSVTLTAIPSGSNTQVQFNDGGSVFGGTAGLTFNKTTNSLTVTGDITGSNEKLSGDLAVNGGNITTTATTFNLVNNTATTVNLAGGATTFNVGNSGATNTFSGTSKFPQGISGSLTKLTDGSSAFVQGVGILVTSASNGPVTITMSNTGSAGTYGSVSQVPVFNADAQGRVTAVTNTPIAIDGSQIVSGNISVPIVPLRLGSSGIQSITSSTTQITPTGTYHRITNTTGGNITLSNAQASINWPGATVGQVLIVQMVVVPGLKNVVLTRGATTKLALDGATVTLSPGASATFIYDGNLWVETAFMNGTSAP